MQSHFIAKSMLQQAVLTAVTAATAAILWHRLTRISAHCLILGIRKSMLQRAAATVVTADVAVRMVKI